MERRLSSRPAGEPSTRPAERGRTRICLGQGLPALGKSRLEAGVPSSAARPASALAPPAEHLVHFAPEVAVKKKTQMGNMLAGLFLLIVVALIVLAGWVVVDSF